MIRRLLARPFARRRARAEHHRAVAAHLAQFCPAQHPEHPGVTCSWYVGDRPDGRHPYDHDGDGYEWPQDPCWSTATVPGAGPTRCALSAGHPNQHTDRLFVWKGQQ